MTPQAPCPPTVSHVPTTGVSPSILSFSSSTSQHVPHNVPQSYTHHESPPCLYHTAVSCLWAPILFTRRYQRYHSYFLFLYLLRCFNSIGLSYSSQPVLLSEPLLSSVLVCPFSFPITPIPFANCVFLSFSPRKHNHKYTKSVTTNKQPHYVPSPFSSNHHLTTHQVCHPKLKWLAHSLFSFPIHPLSVLCPFSENYQATEKRTQTQKEYTLLQTHRWDKYEQAHKLTHNLCSNPLSSCSLCNSTHLSHFAMFFLAVRTKSSIVLPTFLFFPLKHLSFSCLPHHQLP